MSAPSYNSILVCNATLNTAEPINDETIQSIREVAPMFCSESNNTLCLTRFQMYDYITFVTQLVAMRDILKTHKNKLTTNIIAVLYRSEDENDITMVQIKTTNKEIKHIKGNIKVSFSDKDETEKHKTLTVEEKLKLIQEWHNEHPEEFPNSKTTHKNFKLGKFIEKSEKDAKLKVDIDSIFKN